MAEEKASALINGFSIYWNETNAKQRRRKTFCKNDNEQ